MKISKTLIIILLIGLVLGGIRLGIHLKETTNKPADRGCIEVGPESHLYRGQCLPIGYKPSSLVPLSPRDSWLDTKQYLDIRAALVFEQLIEDAQEDGMCLVVSSGYRSFEEQAGLKEKATNKDLVADPGSSEHQTGLAADLVACPMKNGVRDDSAERLELTKEFEDLPEYVWLAKNAPKYDLEQSYRVDNIDKTEYPVESWHWKLILN